MTTMDATTRLSPAELRGLYEQMVLSRVFETESERQYKAAKIGGYCHLSSGQEATTVGVVHTMQADDILVTPSLAKISPLPAAKIVGNLGEKADVLRALGIEETN